MLRLRADAIGVGQMIFWFGGTAVMLQMVGLGAIRAGDSVDDRYTIPDTAQVGSLILQGLRSHCLLKVHAVFNLMQARDKSP